MPMLERVLTFSPGEDDSPTMIERSWVTIDLKIVSPLKGPSVSDSISFLNSKEASLNMATKPMMFSLAKLVSLEIDIVSVWSVVPTRFRFTPWIMSDIWLDVRINSTPFTVSAALVAVCIVSKDRPLKSEVTEKALFDPASPTSWSR